MRKLGSEGNKERFICFPLQILTSVQCGAAVIRYARTGRERSHAPAVRATPCRVMDARAKPPQVRKGKLFATQALFTAHNTVKDSLEGIQGLGQRKFSLWFVGSLVQNRGGTEENSPGPLMFLTFFALFGSCSEKAVLLQARRTCTCCWRTRCGASRPPAAPTPAG